MTPAPILEPDRGAMLQHLETVFLGDYDGAIDGLVELAWTAENGALSNAALFGTHQLEEFTEQAASLNRTPGCNVYVGAALRKPGTPPGKRASDADFYTAPFAWADVDDDRVGAAVERTRATGTMAHLTVVTGRRPHTRAQFWWRLAEASRDSATHRALCGALCKALGGDPTVVNPGRVMRIGGSVAWPVKSGRVLERTEVHVPRDGRPAAYWSAFLMERFGGTPALPAPPGPAGAASEGAKRTPDKAPDIRPETRNHPGLAIGGLSVEATLAAVRNGQRWHDTTVRLVAHWIARGLSDAEILAMAAELTLPGWTADQTRRDLARMIEGGRRKWNMPNPTHAVEDKPPPAALAATWRDGAMSNMIRNRRRIVGSFALRGHVSLLLAPPGAGKSTLAIAMAIAAVTGRDDIVGMPIHERVKAWVYNLEDDNDELDRRLAAAMTHWNVAPADIRGRFALNSGVARTLCIARKDRDGTIKQLPDLDEIVAEIERSGIGLLIVDPLIETHQADENDNAQMQAVGAMWRDVAHRTGCAVILVHHTGKPPSAAPDAWVGSLSASRGASSLGGVARSAATLFNMSERDAERTGVDPTERHRWVRLDEAKANLSLASGKARWFERIGVAIPNGEEIGLLVPGDPAEGTGVEDRRERVREFILREVAAAWTAWTRDQSRLPLSNEARAPRDRRIKDVIPPLAGCAPREAEAVADEMLAAGSIVTVEFIHNKGARIGLRPAKSDERGTP